MRFAKWLLRYFHEVARWQLYQQCADGCGHDQTCAPEKGCIFSPIAELRFFSEQCRAAFGVTPEQTQSAVAFNSVNYGDNRPGGSRIAFVNGKIDPFHYGSVIANTSDLTSREIFALLVDDGSHCADMGSPSPHDLPAMAEAKLVKRAWVRAVVGLRAETRKE